MAHKMLVDIDRCIGCWTCAMGCKVGNHLEDDEYRVEIKTHGSGQGIDRPEGVYPDLHMWWQPVYLPSCNFCAERMKEGEPAVLRDGLPNASTGLRGCRWSGFCLLAGPREA